MTAFLIILLIIAVLIIALLCVSATFTIIYENGWHTTVQILFFKKDIVLSDLLSLMLSPKNKNEKKTQANPEKSTPKKAEAKPQNNTKKKPKKEKRNYFRELWDEEGIVGILSLATDALETASIAISTLIRGFHIHSFYVKMIIGGGDAAQIAQDYGKICSYYYPLKGVILSTMKVDNYDDCIQSDFIAPSSEYELQIIGSISVGRVLLALIKAGYILLKKFLHKGS